MKSKCFLTKRIFREILVRVLFILLIMITTFGFVQIWWPYNPVRVDNFIIEKTILNQGESTYFQFQGEKFYNIPCHVSIELVNGENFAIMSYVSNNPKGTIFKKRSFIIPYHIPAGKYQLRWTGVYEMNPLNSVTKVAYSKFITILNKDLHGEKGDKGDKGSFTHF